MAQDLEARLQALEAKVGELQDREALRLLRCRYHECINESKLAEIPDLFTEDGVLDFGYLGKAQGQAELKKFFDALPRLLQFVKQFIHNHVVQFTEIMPPASVILKQNQFPKARVTWWLHAMMTCTSS